MVLWVYYQEHRKAQLAVVLVLKRLRRWGHGLKSHPTKWEKPGIEPATPGLQGIGVSPTPRRLLFSQRLYSHVRCALPREYHLSEIISRFIRYHKRETI